MLQANLQQLSDKPDLFLKAYKFRDAQKVFDSVQYVADEVDRKITTLEGDIQLREGLQHFKAAFVEMGEAINLGMLGLAETQSVRDYVEKSWRSLMDSCYVKDKFPSDWEKASSHLAGAHGYMKNALSRLENGAKYMFEDVWYLENYNDDSEYKHNLSMSIKSLRDGVDLIKHGDKGNGWVEVYKYDW